MAQSKKIKALLDLHSQERNSNRMLTIATLLLTFVRDQNDCI